MNLNQEKKLKSRLKNRNIHSNKLFSGSAFVVFFLVLFFCNVFTAEAATRTWDGGGADNNWMTANNWSTDVAPVAKDRLIFTGTTRLATNNNFPVNTSFDRITISASGFTLGGNAVTITGYITDSTTSGSNTISLGLVFNSTRIITVTNAAETLTVSGVVSGAGGLTKAGSGVMILSGSNSHTGITTISAGTLKLGSAGSGSNTPLGTIGGITSVTSGAVLDLNGFTLATAEPLTLNGTGITSGGALTNSSATAVTYSGLITLGSASSIIANNGNIIISNAGTITGGTRLLTLGGTNTASNIASVIGNTSGGVTKIGTGTWTLSGTNTYTGVTTLTAGTLSVATIGNGGVAGNLGAATNAAANLVFNGGTLQYTGATSSTNRNFSIIAAKTATIDITTNNLTISGASNITTGILTKIGVGTLTLSGVNNTTTVNAGTLLVTGSTASGSTVTVNNSGTLGGTGTVGSPIVMASGGALAPGTGGTTIGTLATAAVTMNSSSIYSVDLNGTGTTSDKINSSGTVACAGTLTVASIANAAIGKVYTIVSASTVSGTFLGLANGATFNQQGRTFQINYTGTVVTLTDILSGTLTVDIVDASGVSVSTPSINFSPLSFSFNYQTSNGVFGTSSQKIRIDNSTANSQWSLSIAASVPTSYWQGSTSNYDFNDPTANAVDGDDADSYGGLMTINPSTGTITPKSGCTNTGLTLGSTGSFSQGVMDSITLLTSGSSAQTGCYWDLTGVGVSQTVPAEQNTDEYSLDMMLSIIAI